MIIVFMIKEFVKSVSIYGILPIIGKFLNFLLLPIYVKTFSPDEYGIVDLFEIFVLFLFVIASMEIPLSYGRFFYDEKTTEHKKKVFNTSFVLTLIATILVIITAVLLKNVILRNYIGSLDYDNLFYLSMVWLFVLNINTFLSFVPRYDKKPKSYVVVGLISVVIKLLSAIFFVVILRQGLVGVLYGYICGNTISLLLYSYMARKYFTLTFSKSFAVKTIKYSLPMVPGAVLVEFWKPILRYCITFFFPIALVGIYAFASRITSINYLIYGALKTAWMPMLYEKKEDLIKGDNLKRISGLVIICSVFLGLFIITFSKELTLFIGTAEYLDSVKIIGMLVVSGLIQMLTQLRGIGPYISNRTSLITISNIVASLIGVSLFYLIGNKIGILVVGVVSIVYELVNYLILVIYTEAKYKLSLHNSWELLSTLMLSFVCYTSICDTSLMIRCVIFAITSLICLLIFIQNYLKNRNKNFNNNAL